MDKNYIVTKSNVLINCSYDLSIQQQKMILTLASMVQPQDIEFKEYEFKIKDFIELLGVEDKKKYTELPKIAEGLMRPFRILDDGDLVQIAWLSSARHKKKQGIITLRFDPTLKPYMLGLKEFYTSYKLENILSLKSKYSIRLYEILKSNLFKKCINIELEEFKNILGAKEKTYNTYGNLKSKILIQAQKELAEKTDISFTYDEIKTGRKVTSIKFTITSNKNICMNKIAATSSSGHKEQQQNIDDININQVKAIIKEDIEELAAKKIYDIANGDIERIKEKYSIVSQLGKVGNLVGAMIRALQENWTTTGKSKISTFNDYEQRSYDFDELEKKLLGWEN